MKWILFFIIIILSVACSSQRKSQRREKKFDSTFSNPFYKNNPHPKIFFAEEKKIKEKKIEKVSIRKKRKKVINKKIDAKREEIVKYALSFEGKKKFDKKFRYDCSGFVRMVYSKFNINLFNLKKSQFKENGKWVNGSKLIYRYSKINGSVYKSNPQIGDFIFFDNTTDRNKDGKLNDYFTHIAIIVKIEKNGTIHYIHKSNRGINIQKMNLKYPSTSYLKIGKKKKKINSYLRKKRRKDNKKTKYLSSQMFRSFGTIFNN